MKAATIAGVGVMIYFVSAWLSKDTTAMAICVAAVYLGCCITSLKGE